MLPETITKLETIKPETAKLEARKEIRKNLIRYLARCSIEHLKRKTSKNNCLCKTDNRKVQTQYGR